MDWITDRLPTAEDADIDGDVIVTDGDGEAFVPWKTVTPSDLWRQPDVYELPAPNITDDRWITTRQPMTLDGNKDGAVHVRKYPDKNWGVNIHWSYVGPGVPWQHTNDYEGLVEPIPFEARLEDIPEEPVLTEGEPSDNHVRTFASVKRTYVDKSCVIDAVASDGTFWCLVQQSGMKGQWTQMPNLPQE